MTVSQKLWPNNGVNMHKITEEIVKDRLRRGFSVEFSKSNKEEVIKLAEQISEELNAFGVCTYGYACENGLVSIMKPEYFLPL